MEKLKQLLLDLENKIPYQEIINTKISKSSVGWHIEHIVLTMNIVIEQVRKSNPSKYKWSFNFKRILVFTLNKIPRGKARAPKIVQPSIDFNSDSIKTQLEKAKNNIDCLYTMGKNQYLEHPYFGHLNLKPTIKFLEIHSNHHLKIINDIIKNDN